MASGLTGPSCSRRRRRRSIRASRSARETSSSSSSAGAASSPSFSASRLELAPGVGRAVARLLRAHLAAGDLLAALLQAALDLRLLGSARPQLARQPLAGLAVGAQLRLDGLHPHRDNRSGALEHRREPLGGGPQRLVACQPVALAGDPLLALGALAFGALGEPPLGTDGRLELGAPLGGGTLVRRRLPLLDHPAGVAVGLRGLVACPRRGARGTLGVVACRVGGLDGPRGLLDVRQRGLLGLRRALDLGDEAVATVALGEHAVLAAGGDLPQLARDRRPHAPVARDGHAGEAGSERVERVDDPRAGEQRRGEPAVAVRAHVLRERLGAGRRCDACRARRRGVGHDQRRAAVAPRAVEQPRALAEVGGDGRAQARPERGRERELVAGIGAEAVGERRGAARRAGVGAQELVELRELGAGARGLAAGVLGRRLGLAAGAPGRLGGGVRLAPHRAGGIRRLGQACELLRGLRAPGL